MSNGILEVPFPVNEPVLDHAPGSPERAALQAELAPASARQTQEDGVVGGRHQAGPDPDPDRDVLHSGSRDAALGVRGGAGGRLSRQADLPKRRRWKKKMRPTSARRRE